MKMVEGEKEMVAAGLSQDEFIAGFRKGDPRVIHFIYETHFVRLCDFCFYFLGNSFDAQDIVSDIFEKLLTVDRKNKVIGKSFTDMNDVVNYLYVAARNNCFNVLEQRKRKRQINLDVTERKYANEEELDLECHRGLADLKLLETVYKLNQRSVKVLRKLYFEDMSYEQIAAEMNITRSTVGNLRQQGINLLAKKLNREDFILHFFIFAMLSIFSL